MFLFVCHTFRKVDFVTLFSTFDSLMEEKVRNMLNGKYADEVILHFNALAIIKKEMCNFLHIRLITLYSLTHDT